MENIIIIVILVIIVGFAGLYIYKAKKTGKKCIGCPYGDKCASKNAGGSCCNGSIENEKR